MRQKLDFHAVDCAVVFLLVITGLCLFVLDRECTESIS
jgi:hypothetical protein